MLPQNRRLNSHTRHPKSFLWWENPGCGVAEAAVHDAGVDLRAAPSRQLLEEGW